MSDETEKNSEFRVNDRRRFTSSGDEQPAVGQEPAPRESVISAASEKPACGCGSSGCQDNSGEPSEDSRAEGYEVDFSGFIIGLATQTFTFLGEMPDPRSGQSAVNLDAARHTIDILGVLEEKTKGNLTASEEQLLKEVLSSLRIGFVARSRESKNA